MPLSFVLHERIPLKEEPLLNEQWLQDRIAEFPSILGLGELAVIERERRQARAGRLDLLLSDADDDTRYEVELMLGATDASHIIRTIEYWDIERRRYPAYEHVAVIVAEDITSRFLNVLSLFAGSIPLIAIQLNALKVGDQIVLDCVKVLDRRDLRTDDESGDVSGPADRAYWEEKAGTSSLRLIDAVLSLVNEKAEPPMDLDFIRGTIRLRDHGRATKFISFKPRRKHVTVRFKIPNPEAWAERCENAGLASDVHRNGHLRVKVEPSEFEQHRSLLTEAVTEAVKAYSE